ncbi:MAG: hypothetical protein ACTHMJ_19225 [Thermomicrobiales bacterium]|jgi:hypothetical protein|nr:hypothetical protein [Thermomicrobiales bacterium]
MSAWVWILLILVIVLLVIIAWLVVTRRRSEQLRAGFGPEYQRAVAERGDRRHAESELAARQERVEALHIRPLPPADRERFATDWHTAQAHFVDDPGSAIQDADHLVAEVMQARGYPVGKFEQRAADISVDHPDVVEHYRAAHQIAETNGRGEANTEDLRQAMVHYRALFEELLGTREQKPKEVRS